ncbi:hypothetical protein EVAR_87382_1 [Eumeta japonica]|uniref:Uncharacterized protein n=1 Tax=Eumeta variegata TaxID=151549 RepID=A0A4C1Y2R6_EUMVA|nr:hypothetical protein EVAR_87382_1 [Eumeta japonica]
MKPYSCSFRRSCSSCDSSRRPFKISKDAPAAADDGRLAPPVCPRRYEIGFVVGAAYEIGFVVGAAYEIDFVVGAAYEIGFVVGAAYEIGFVVGAAYEIGFVVGAAYEIGFVVGAAYEIGFVVGAAYEIGFVVGATYEIGFTAVQTFSMCPFPSESAALGAPACELPVRQRIRTPYRDYVGLAKTLGALKMVHARCAFCTCTCCARADAYEVQEPGKPLEDMRAFDKRVLFDVKPMKIMYPVPKAI